MKVEEKVALLAIKQAPESHILIDAAICGTCENRICLRACPADLYTVEGGQVIVDHSGCLECGTCMIVCQLGAISWRYPDAGFGIRYRYG